jgi:hypothetical protein
MYNDSEKSPQERKVSIREGRMSAQGAMLASKDLQKGESSIQSPQIMQVKTPKSPPSGRMGLQGKTSPTIMSKTLQEGAAPPSQLQNHV